MRRVTSCRSTVGAWMHVEREAQHRNMGVCIIDARGFLQHPATQVYVVQPVASTLHSAHHTQHAACVGCSQAGFNLAGTPADQQAQLRQLLSQAQQRVPSMPGLVSVLVQDGAHRPS